MGSQRDQATNFAKQALYVTAVWLGLVVLCYALLGLVQILPSASYESHLPASIDALKKATNGYQNLQAPAFGSIEFASVDYYGDALMLEASMYDPNCSFITNVVSPSLYIRLDRPGMNGDNNPPLNLEERAQGMVIPNHGHARYWNGYRVPVRILGTFLSYNGMRIVNALALFALAIATGMALYKRFGWQFALLYGISLVATSFYVVLLCLQYSAPYYVMFAGILAVLVLSKKAPIKYWLAPLFFGIGCLTSYFDLLTTPAITLGGPLVVLLFGYLSTSKPTLKKSFSIFFQASVLWTIGYVGFWVTQVLVSQLLTGDPVINNAFQQIDYYGVKSIAESGVFTTYATVFGFAVAILFGQAERSFNEPVAVLRVALGVGVLLAYIGALLNGIRHKVEKRAVLIGSGAMLAVAAIPIARGAVTVDHIRQHPYMTHRELMVTIFALGAYYLLVTRRKI